MTVETVFIDKAIDQCETRLRVCVKAKGRHFEHLLWSGHKTNSSEPLTHQNRFFLEPLTLLRRRQHRTVADVVEKGFLLLKLGVEWQMADPDCEQVTVESSASGVTIEVPRNGASVVGKLLVRKLFFKPKWRSGVLVHYEMLSITYFTYSTNPKPAKLPHLPAFAPRVVILSF